MTHRIAVSNQNFQLQSQSGCILMSSVWFKPRMAQDAQQCVISSVQVFEWMSNLNPNSALAAWRTLFSATRSNTSRAAGDTSVQSSRSLAFNGSRSPQALNSKNAWPISRGVTTRRHGFAVLTALPEAPWCRLPTRQEER